MFTSDIVGWHAGGPWSRGRPHGLYNVFVTINVPVVYMARDVMILIHYKGPETVTSKASVIWAKKIK
jgi:hypothetical protein